MDIQKSLLHNPQFQFGAITFFAKQHKGDTCGSNGLPLTPNSITVYGRAQLLKIIENPYLCQYIDIIRGKHERTVVVSQYCGKPLTACLNTDNLNVDNIKKIAYQILKGLEELQKRNIVNRNLSTENVLLMEDNNIKVFNYGLYYMTGNGQYVAFPVMSVLYTAPEVYLSKPSSTYSHPKGDIWSLGIILAELVINKPLWNSLKLGQIIRKIMSLLTANGSVFERITREHNCYEKYSELPADLKDLINSCLTVYPSNRPSVQDLLKREIFNNIAPSPMKTKSKVCKPFQNFTIMEFYHWWQLAGGDVLLELKKQGLIRTSPPILSLPKAVLMDGNILGLERNFNLLYDPKVVLMPLDTLYRRFSHIPLSSYYPLIHINSDIIKKSEPPQYDASNLPLVIREKDPEYQFHRTILMRRLLHGYPFTRNLIIKESEKDIPPLLRGNIWAALLHVKGDYEKEYAKIDKTTPTPTDRQIEVDIPRCHQYNELLSSSVGHNKLKRILKAWVSKNSQYVYWQGLDSLTAPFLYLNFNDEAKAFACLSSFIPLYLHNFFLKDNAAVIQEYLAKFMQLISFHDPTLANHLHNINFIPELFAIPWFLTMFSHVFPLHKILHLWDKLILGDSSFPLHVGLSILTQLRETLLNSGFNECILLFSDLPEVDIEQCVTSSLKSYNITPRSITYRKHQNENEKNIENMDEMGITVQELNRERCPRIHFTDVVKLVNEEKAIIIDIRNPTQFSRYAVRGSLNIPFSSVTFGSPVLESIGPHGATLKNNTEKVVVVVGTEDTDLELFPKFLLECKVSRVCVLHGGFNVLLPK
ncbi:TBC domain-containing protein kinase-like protein isoform X2 [Agrilus planipennis]|uniref:TBC domain-containing protein kinase-like protein isoform X2 n=1 Tax=Agrilus planipennis TaxID=224129 RepID=A0A7F5R7E6_AGRPL|nr:TBC domain-containing protein kinase-like protein isoform X2 [Agrilus planipennis]